MKIRAIKKEDYEALVSMFREFATFQKTPDRMVNSVERMQKEANLIHGFVIEDENSELIGYVTYFYAYATWSGKSLYMEDLYLKPNYRHLGYGRQLIKRLIAVAKTEECRKVKWQVSRWNKNAIEFYKSLGAEIDDQELNCDLWV